MLQFKAYHWPYSEMWNSKIFFVYISICKKCYRLVNFSVQKVLYAQQSCKMWSQIYEWLLFINSIWKTEKQNTNTCKYSLLSCHTTEKLLSKRSIQLFNCLQTKYWDSHTRPVFQHCSVWKLLEAFKWLNDS